MMDLPVQRKPRLHFETAPYASNVAFDDGKECRMLPWSRCGEVRWGAEPDTIKLEIGGWLVIISGRNLAPVCRAIVEQTLQWITAHAEFENMPDRRIDSYATKILFLKAPSKRAHGAHEVQDDLFFPR